MHAAKALLLGAVLLSACSHVTKPQKGAFLSDYSTLMQTKDAQGHEYFAHRQVLKLTNRHDSYAVSVDYFPTHARFDGLGTETQARIASYLQQAIEQQFRQRGLLANGQADIQLRVAITAVAAVDPDMKPWDFLPVRLLTKPIKDGVLGAPKLAAATLEVRATESRTGEVLSESVRMDNGNSIGRQTQGVSVVTFESLHGVLDQWAASLASEQQ
jgi:hypothetical protein